MTNSTNPLALEVAQLLFAKTLTHPVIGHLAQWVPTQWLLDLSNPDADTKTDLGTWEEDAPLVGLDELFANMLAMGMRDPFVVGVGRVTRRVRLEAGNHRVRVLLAKQIFQVPAVAYVGDSAITHAGNGLHEGQCLPLLLPASPDIMGPYPIKAYMKLSDVLVSMPCRY